jgi:hypothetical protein
VNDRIKQLLRELGSAINESISTSEDVNQHMERIRAEGYDLYVVLDATIGLNKQGAESDSEGESTAVVPSVPDHEVQFRINVSDLALLRSIGIDPTRKVKTARRVEPLRQISGE